MPLYEIEHVCPITPDQQQSIANAIVKIHSEMFTTPSLFVNVRFKDTNALPLFVAGQRVSSTATTKTRFHSFTLLYPSTFTKICEPPYLSSTQAEIRSYCLTRLTLSLAIQRTVNYILAHVRHGPSRTQEHYNSVCASIASAWASIIGTTSELELRGIFILGDIVAGWEAGFPIPQAGQDKAWLKHYVSDFKKLADAGDADFAGVMKELETRKDLQDILAH